VNVVRELLADEIRGAAFRRLLAHGSSARAEELADDLGRSVGEVTERLREFADQGRIRLDELGRVIGSAGLSVEPDRHRIELHGRTFWTWCAYDVVGIFGALRATGTAYSSSPVSAVPLEVVFRDGRPDPTGVVLFRPDQALMDCCPNVYHQWCPNSNFFEGVEMARRWAREHGLTGAVLGLAEATELGAQSWAPLCT
jgi:alkylmercury lyase